MLYPDFNDLISYQGRKFDKMRVAQRKMSVTTSGGYRSLFRGQGLDFDAVREYVPGDDIRNIDWKVTARTGSPHLKLFKEEKERHTIISVDMNRGMRFGTRNTFKSIQAARSCALLGWRALSHQDRVSGCFFGDVAGGVKYIASKRTRKALCTMLKTLSEPPVEDHLVSLETVLTHICRVAHPGSLIYLISDFMDLPSTLRLPKGCDIVFISINDVADKTLAPAGVLGFCGQQEKVYINTDSIKGRKTYTAEWEANRKELHSLTKRFKIPLIQLSTESDIYRDLLLGLRGKHGSTTRH